MYINLDNGSIILKKNDYSIDVFSALKRLMDSGILPIPVEGDVQIFADPECTKLPSGVIDKVYARFNTGTAYGEHWSDSDFSVITPDNDYPDDPYFLNWYVDFYSRDFNEPFTAGQVVVLTAPEPYDVTGRQTTFYK